MGEWLASLVAGFAFIYYFVSLGKVGRNFRISLECFNMELSCYVLDFEIFCSRYYSMCNFRAVLNNILKN